MPFDGVLADAVGLSVFNRAADLLEKEGWCIDMLIDRYSGQRCLNGALRRARGVEENHQHDHKGYNDEDNALARALGFSDAGEAADWNNVQDSGAPVIDRLRQAAKRELTNAA